MDDVELPYEAHLTRLPLPDLLAEPGALQTQAHHLTSSLTSLTHTSYPTFLSLHQTTSALSHSLTSLADSLSDLITTSLPALQDATAAWHTRTTDVLHERSKARLVLDQHDKIKNLLDIPIFIESCVRNGYFQEALALSSHVSAMASRPGASPILASIHAEVEAAITQMLVVLLGTLNEPGRKLPALWKAVNFLRKMDAFGPCHDRSQPEISACLTHDDGGRASSEELLALAFLSGRLTCLTAALEPTSRDIHRLIDPVIAPTSADHDVPPRSSISNHTDYELSDRDTEDIARYLKKYIDIWREGAYDILTQYSTIFLEQQQQQPHPISPQPQSKSPTAQRRTSIQIQPTPPPTPSFLPLLAPHLLSHLLPLLQTTLPLLPLPLLPSLLTQLTYCATAFTRVGLDFRGLIGGIINSAVVSAVHRGLRHDVGSLLGSGKTTIPATQKPSEWLVIASHVDAPPAPPPTATPSQAQGQAHIPPQVLTAYPPLARQTNAILGVLNALRLLAPVAVMLELVGVLDGVLAGRGEELVLYLRAFVVGVGDEGKEKEVEVDKEKRVEDRVARAAGDAYFKVLVPFVRRALVEGVYGVEIAKLGEVEGEGVEALRKVVREWDDVNGT